ncbi:MAG: hypothetical protein LBO00_07455, partial [Zoogloeaceae bacterium]|nr:hypothetical protein [Zoogloeaceae bacterium]
ETVFIPASTDDLLVYPEPETDFATGAPESGAETTLPETFDFPISEPDGETAPVEETAFVETLPLIGLPEETPETGTF